MNFLTTRRLVGTALVLALLWLCSAVASAQQPAAGPKEIDPEVVAAWKKAGAEVGWCGPNEYDEWEFYKIKPNNLEVLPAFRWSSNRSVKFANLPAPSQPFALDLAQIALEDRKP